MAADLGGLLADLTAETRVLEDLLEPLDAAAWQRPTPSPGWTIHDQVSHLAYFDETATLAATDPDRFRAEAAVGGARPRLPGRDRRPLPQAAPRPSCSAGSWARGPGTWPRCAGSAPATGCPGTGRT